MNAFADWLKAKQIEKDWSLSKLASFIGFSHTHITNIINGDVRASEKVVVATAKAFNESSETLLHLAGYVDVRPAVAEEKEAVAILRALSPQERQTALAMLRGLKPTSQQDITPQAEPVQNEKKRLDNEHAIATLLSGLEAILRGHRTADMSSVRRETEQVVLLREGEMRREDDVLS